MFMSNNDLMLTETLPFSDYSTQTCRDINKGENTQVSLLYTWVSHLGGIKAWTRGRQASRCREDAVSLSKSQPQFVDQCILSAVSLELGRCESYPLYKYSDNKVSTCDQSHILVQATIYRRLWIGRDGHR